MASILCQRAGVDQKLDDYARSNGGAEAPCAKCRRPVWLSPSSQALTGASAAAAYCSDCVAGEIDQRTKAGEVIPFALAPGALKELLDRAAKELGMKPFEQWTAEDLVENLNTACNEASVSELIGALGVVQDFGGNLEEKSKRQLIRVLAAKLTLKTMAPDYITG
jgi:hypothetical protein